MKNVILVLLGLAAVMFFGILVAGVTSESVVYKNSVVIERPVEDVWTTLTDTSRMKEWKTDLDTIENLSGSELEVGSRRKLVFGEDERIETVTVVEPPIRYTFDMETDVSSGNTNVRLITKDGGTELTSTTKVVGSNVFWRGVLVYKEDSLTERKQGQYELLKKIIEGPQ